MSKPPSGDDLDRPLGTEFEAREGTPRDFPYGLFGLAAIALIGIGLGVFAHLTGDDRSGAPMAVAAIAAPVPSAPTATVAPPSAAAAASMADDVTGAIPGRRRTATAGEVEAQSGVRVVRSGGAGAPGALIIEVPDDLRTQLTPAPDKRLVERFDRGVLPKIGADGARPADVYARPVVLPANLKSGAPRVALVVGGMGISAAGTAEAIAKLPGAVTLGFAPYGAGIADEAAQARDGGHEIVLQTPMESFSYPADDFGPETLLTSLDAAQNLQRLHRLMSRFPGYVGLVNYLGGKFTADAAAFGPVLRDIADRGLIYVDDGTSTRNAVGQLAPGLDLPVVRVDVVLDAVARPEAIDAALLRLEAIARRKGVAVGSASGLPISIDALVRWTRGIEGRGIALVPISAVAGRLQAVADGAADGR